jgi:pentatricopeptide repeat protein
MPDSLTSVQVLNACASFRDLDKGRKIHTCNVESSCESDVNVSNSLVDIYAKCGSIQDAWNIFSRMPTHDAVSWSVIIRGYVKFGQGQHALELSKEMQCGGSPCHLCGHAQMQVYEHLRRADTFTHRSFKLTVSQISVW